jgi:hypothetical protein
MRKRSVFFSLSITFFSTSFAWSFCAVLSSCLEQRLIVVINETLMENHQQELGEALEKEGYLTCTTVKNVLQVLKSLDLSKSIKPYPGLCLLFSPCCLPAHTPSLLLLSLFVNTFFPTDPNYDAFPNLLDEEMGFTSSKKK